MRERKGEQLKRGMKFQVPGVVCLVGMIVCFFPPLFIPPLLRFARAPAEAASGPARSPNPAPGDRARASGPLREGEGTAD